MPYQAGDVLLADLDPVAGHEQGGRRPVLVLSGPSYNELRNKFTSPSAPIAGSAPQAGFSPSQYGPFPRSW